MPWAMNATAHALVSASVAPQAAPAGFRSSLYESEYTVAAPLDRVWGWLEDPATFVDGQVFPYRVEFVSPAPDTLPGFAVGGLNIHHGPFLHLPGVLTEIREQEYRELRYFYGSYVLSPRLVRPTRLEFWVAEAEPGTRVRLALSSYVRDAFAPIWERGQRWFWGRFPHFMAKGVGAPLTG